MGISKLILTQSYPTHFYHVLPEVKEYNDNTGDCRLRLDILIMGDDPSSSACGYELVVSASKSVFDEHLNRAKKYSELHHCPVYAVNLCNTAKNNPIDYFGQEYPNVIPVHVIYDKKKGTAKIVYKDNETSVKIKSSEWQVIWK